MIEYACEVADILIVDLGVGPGSLAVRLLDRLRLAEQDLRKPDWPAALGLDRKPDAFVSTTALHWLHQPDLAALYTTLAGLLRPGGVLVNGDHLYDRPVRPELGRLCSHVADRRTGRVRAATASGAPPENWTDWWTAALSAPELSDLVAERVEAVFTHTSDPEVSLDTHVHLLRGAGFTEAGTVWQHGGDRVLVGIR